MTKTITKVGNSQGIIFDAALMDLARIKVGDQINVTVVPESGAILLIPLRPGLSKEEISSVTKKTARDYRKTLRKLASAPRPKIASISASTSFARFTQK